MTEFVCNFAIARFRPYRETGEFVNVGIVLICPELGYFGSLFEHRKYKRITDFFPELHIDTFKAGLGALMLELARLKTASTQPLGQFVFPGEAKSRIIEFKELIRPRESIFHFSEAATSFATDPEAKLIELFDFYIKRQFARDREYQEVIMRRRLNEFLQKAKLLHYYKQDQRVGNEDYGITLPFVHMDQGVPRKAIKPLHLAKSAPTEIYRHGDAWIAAVKRLRQINHLPEELLFTIKYPTNNSKHQNAALEICSELQKLNITTVSFSDTEAIRSFAQV